MTVNKQITLPSQKAERSGFNYSYIVLMSSTFIIIASVGIMNSFGVFLKPVLNDFGWTRTAISGAYSMSWVLNGVFGIVLGMLGDRFGPRIVVTVGGLLLGLGFLLMSFVTAIWQFYLFYGILISIGLAVTGVPLISNLNRWFIKNRGLAIGVVMAGAGIGMVAIPSLANLLISNYHWRTSYLLLGSVVLVLLVILAQFLRPSPIGKSLLPADAGEAKSDISNIQVQGFSFREAMGSWQLWIICVIFMTFNIGVQTIMAHIVPHATDIGFSSTTATAIISVIGLSFIVGAVGAGKLGDRIGNRQGIIIILMSVVISFIGFRFSSEIWMLYLFAIFFGLGFGGINALSSPLVAGYFGLRSLGAIFGLTMFAAALGGALGSLIAGRIFDISGSYQWAFILGALVNMVALILVLLLKLPGKQTQANSPGRN